MQDERLHSLLDSPDEAQAWFESLGLTNGPAAQANLVRLADTGLPIDLLGTICQQFADIAPKLADPDMALNNLRFPTCCSC